MMKDDWTIEDYYYNGGEKSYYKQVIRDKIKKDFADKNGIFVALNYKEGRIDLLEKKN